MRQLGAFGVWQTKMTFEDNNEFDMEMDQITEVETVKEVEVPVEVVEKNHDNLENRDKPNQHPISAISGLEDRFTDVKIQFVKVENQLSTVKDQFTDVEKQFSEVDSQFDEVEEQVDTVENELIKVKTKLETNMSAGEALTNLEIYNILNT